MSAAAAPYVRLSLAAATLGVAGAVVGLIGGPVAHADELTCSDGLVASADGTCVPQADGPGATPPAQGPLNAPESSLDDPGLFTPPYELTEDEVAAPGYNTDGGGGRR